MTDFFDTDKYPVGVQSFETLRNESAVYVDKTAYIYKITRTSRSYFLSRPRRFGKSLLLSTIEAYFQGRRELFDGLAISKLETEWKWHPVIHISLGKGELSTPEGTNAQLQSELLTNSKVLDIPLSDGPVATQFAQLIVDAYLKYQTKVVVLVDEYDKPLQDTLHEDESMSDQLRSMLRGFYGCVKDSGKYLRFVMLTGVTKFGQVSVFSGLNNLIDLSLEQWSNAICGISESEIQQYFADDTADFARLNSLDVADAAAKLKTYYDGYRFAASGENIYNPYSLLCAFSNMKLGNYWFQTGTPTSLLKYLIKHSFDLSGIDGIRATADELMSAGTLSKSPVPLLYQTGYLTIKDFEEGYYTLGFPNREVSEGFFHDLLDMVYSDTGTDFSATKLKSAAIFGEPHKVVQLLQTAIGKFNHHQHARIKNEQQLNGLLYSIVMTFGLDCKAEYAMSSGRIDMFIKTRKYLYLIEFKVNSTAQAAIQQIEDRDYAFAFNHLPQTIFKIGINYNIRLHKLDDYIITDAEGNHI